VASEGVNVSAANETDRNQFVPEKNLVAMLVRRG
jgi:hypothetical protein